MPHWRGAPSVNLPFRRSATEVSLACIGWMTILLGICLDVWGDTACRTSLYCTTICWQIVIVLHSSELLAHHFRDGNSPSKVPDKPGCPLHRRWRGIRGVTMDPTLSATSPRRFSVKYAGLTFFLPCFDRILAVITTANARNTPIPSDCGALEICNGQSRC